MVKLKNNWRILLKSQISYKTLLETKVSLEEVSNIANEILTYIPNNAIVALNGDLAAGKTTLVSAIVNSLNLGLATSPTFSLQQTYSDRVFHYDFYRLEYEEIVNLGLINELEKDGLHFIEWAPAKLIELLNSAGFSLFAIDIEKLNSSRKYILKAINA